jgi:hypothetical protein
VLGISAHMSVATVRIELPLASAGAQTLQTEPGMHRGQVVVCQSRPVVVNDQAHQDVEWVWDITPQAQGATSKAEITNTSAPDDNLANNSAAVTVLVAPVGGEFEWRRHSDLRDREHGEAHALRPKAGSQPSLRCRAAHCCWSARTPHPDRVRWDACRCEAHRYSAGEQRLGYLHLPPA